MEREEMECETKIGESSRSKTVIVRVKRKLSHSPLQALWVEINDRPFKRPALDFRNLSISSSSKQQQSQEDEELEQRKRVLVEHVETLPSSQASLHFLHHFLQPDEDVKPSSKERTRTFPKHNKQDHLLSKAKQQHQELAKTARFQQIWKRRTPSHASANHDPLHEICRVYDVLRVDALDTPKNHHSQDISAQDQALLAKFLPLLKDCLPDAAHQIESDFSSQPSTQDTVGEYVYDLYAVKDQMDDTEASYPFPLVQVDDDDQLYDGLDDSDYESDDSNAEDHPRNDYPEEESSDEEEKSDASSAEPEEDGSATESDVWLKSDDSVCLDRSEDPLGEYEIDGDSDDGSYPTYSEDAGNEGEWRWAHR